jgi:ribosomal protein S16
MARVERGNVVLQVKDHEVQHYLNLGYNLTDETGKVLKESIPTNIGVLQTAYLEHTKKIAELEDTVAKLTAQLSAKKTTTKKAKEE